MMIKIIFFDFDGVLTLEKSGTQTVINNLSELLGEIPELESKYKAATKGYLTGDIDIKQVIDNLKKQQINVNVNILLKAFEKVKLNNELLIKIKRLKKQYKTGIISDTNVDRFNVLRQKLLLDEYFNYFVISGFVGSTKHEEKIFNEAFKAAKSRLQECLFINPTERKPLLLKQWKNFSHISVKLTLFS
jgi:putative hydrolase of the HAD superfamily